MGQLSMQFEGSVQRPSIGNPRQEKLQDDFWRHRARRNTTSKQLPHAPAIHAVGDAPQRVVNSIPFIAVATDRMIDTVALNPAAYSAFHCIKL
jgi:hypothetical protein